MLELERFGPSGADRVELLLCANPGEELRPLREVASGGETARIMLALRTALAVRRTVPTLVFDEIDAGVGGRLGPAVGEHLRRLSEHHQILCVTHLPAIAALAHEHFKVEKRAAAGRTRTGVERLEGPARVDEVADMIAGGAAHETARAEARRLLDQREA
jgi:DNA repair protein RecN (Recombination protein N)